MRGRRRSERAQWALPALAARWRTRGWTRGGGSSSVKELTSRPTLNRDRGRGRSACPGELESMLTSGPAPGKGLTWRPSSGKELTSGPAPSRTGGRDGRQSPG